MHEQFVYVAFCKSLQVNYLQVAKKVVYATILWILFCIVVTAGRIASRRRLV